MIARGPGGAIASFWAASNVPAVVDRVPPERSALTALSASAGSGLKGATTRGSPPDATTMVRTPSGSRSRNSVAPLCAASNASAVMSDAVSTTRATDRLRRGYREDHRNAGRRRGVHRDHPRVFRTPEGSVRHQRDEQEEGERGQHGNCRRATAVITLE